MIRRTEQQRQIGDPQDITAQADDARPAPSELLTT